MATSAKRRSPYWVRILISISGIAARGAMKAMVSQLACVVVTPRSPAICEILVVTKYCATPCVSPMTTEAPI